MEKDEESFKPHVSSTPIPTRRISLKEVKMNTSSLQCTKLSSLYHNTPNLQTVLSSVNQLIHFQFKENSTGLEVINWKTILEFPASSLIQSVNKKDFGNELFSQEYLLGAVDQKGKIGLIKLPSTIKDSLDNNETNLNSPCFYSSNPDTKRGLESGWNGIEFYQNKILVANMFNKSISQVDLETGNLDHLFSTSLYPTQFTLSRESSSELLGVTEYNHLSIWDLRVTQPCIKRITISGNSTLYAISWVGNKVAISGSSRSVSMFDCRKWTLLGNWSNCLKYEVTSLHLASSDDEICFVGGLDSEIACGICDASGGKTLHETLGDGRWIGLDLMNHGNEIVALSEHGTLYSVDYTKLITKDRILSNSKKQKKN